MGKKLIIKGADFSSVAIDNVNKITWVQGTIQNSTGDWENDNTSYLYKRLKLALNQGVELTAGQSVTLYGVSALKIGVAFYSANSPVQSNCLNVNHLSATNNTEGAESYTFTNTYNRTVFVWFQVGWNGTDGEHNDDGTINPQDIGNDAVSYIVTD